MGLLKVAVIGAGTMGRGIAQWFSQQGLEVELTDANHEALKDSAQLVFKSWDKLEQKGKFSSSEVKTFKENLKTVSIEELSTDNDLIIEAIIENLKIKHSVFLDLDKKMEEKTIFASNTSSIPITDLASPLTKHRKERFLGLHFFNPAPIMKLVEVIKGDETNQEYCDKLENWFREKGKMPAQCKDAPGFIVNRVARNFYGEAFRIAGEEDTKKFKEIDDVMKEVGGFRMGPFELMDLIGIDINYDVTCSVWEAFDKNERFSPHRIQKQMVDSGRLGRKTGKGFYSYE